MVKFPASILVVLEGDINNPATWVDWEMNAIIVEGNDRIDVDAKALRIAHQIYSGWQVKVFVGSPINCEPLPDGFID